MMHKLSPFVLFCSLCSIANTKLTPESPTRWEGSRISIAKSNSSFLVSTFPGVEEKTGNFSCSLFGGSQSGDVDLICAVSGSPEVRVHVMKARAGMWHTALCVVFMAHLPCSLCCSTHRSDPPRYLWRITQLHKQQSRPPCSRGGRRLNAQRNVPHRFIPSLPSLRGEGNCLLYPCTCSFISPTIIGHMPWVRVWDRHGGKSWEQEPASLDSRSSQSNRRERQAEDVHL